MPETSAEPILAFDTAGPALSIAVCDGPRALAALHLPMQRGHVELLLPAVRQALATIPTQVGARLDALETLVVDLGLGLRQPVLQLLDLAGICRLVPPVRAARHERRGLSKGR